MVFGRSLDVSQHEELDTFESFGGTFIPGPPSRIITSIPPSLFTRGRRNDRTFEAIVTLGATLPENRASPVTDYLEEGGYERQESLTCQGSPLGPPLDGALVVTSFFGPRRPGVGAGTFHKGVDLRASPGTPVKAMADGVVERIGTSVNRQGLGWGYYVVILHADGARSLYAHLKTGSASRPRGSPVARGEVIALSGVSGAKQAHLHVEYIINGRSKVNPWPCINESPRRYFVAVMNTSSRYWKDKFEITVNEVQVCEATASRTCEIMGLSNGTAVLRIKAVETDVDELGHYAIGLGFGMRFEGPGPKPRWREGRLKEDESHTYSLIISDQDFPPNVWE